MSVALALPLVERGLVPDPLVRFGIRRLLAQRLRREDQQQPRRLAELRRAMTQGPISLIPEAANEQHYEVPTALYQLMLGRRLKYSSAYWPEGVSSLDAAEEAMLELTVERAGLADGQEILELGCGWGSLTLFLAERFPAARLLAVSNSATQQSYLAAQLARRGLRNVELRRADVNDLELDRRFDRVVSVEMFEHLRNWRTLTARIARWLRPGGALFVHVFCHRRLAYPFEDREASDWMARHFFSGGLMPSLDLLPSLAEGLQTEGSWSLDGTHYRRTAESWLANLDARRKDALEILEATYGAGQGARWLAAWRLFLLACAELFGYRDGSEWQVAHYFLRRPAAKERLG